MINFLYFSDFSAGVVNLFKKNNNFSLFHPTLSFRCSAGVINNLDIFFSFN